MSTRPLLTAPWFAPALVAVAAWVGIVAAIDPAGSYPNRPAGPGLTVDEMFNVEQGVYLVEAIRQYGLGLLDARSIREVFGGQAYLPDHPPFGRLWLGMHHHLTWAVAPPHDPFHAHGTVTACARTGSATAFALTILLIGWFVGVKEGPLAGCLAALCLPLMPRAWGHAHLASLETITNLTCTAAVLAAAHGWNKSTTPSVRSALIAGALLGLAFLTKIQAILLPIPLAVWCLLRWRLHAIRPLMIWGSTAAIVFFVGWPWLWLNSWGHAREYFAHTTDRAALSVWYFGVKYADTAVPWHYPWVMCAATLPVGMLVFGVCGWWVGGGGLQERKATPHISRWLLAGNAIFPLLVFSLPGIAVYDGERLLLTIFPFWAILAGSGAAALWRKWSHRRVGPILISLCLITSAAQIVRFHPCDLSYYNLLVGGTAGAERLGLETTYWGDSVTRSLLNQVPQNSTVHVAPVLHQFQLDDLLRQSPILRRQGVKLKPFQVLDHDMKYLLVYRRRADLPEELRFGPRDGKLLAEVRRGETQLAALYEFTP